MHCQINKQQNGNAMNTEKKVMSLRLQVVELCNQLAVGEVREYAIPDKEVQPLRMHLTRQGITGISFNRVSEGIWRVGKKPEDALSQRAEIFAQLDAGATRLVLYDATRIGAVQTGVTQYNAERGTVWRCERKEGKEVLVWRDTATEAWLPLRDVLNSPTGTAEDIDKALARLVAYCQQKKARKT